MRYIKWFEEVTLADAQLVGAKVASIGALSRELGPLGVRVPGGFAVTADGYRAFFNGSWLEHAIRDLLFGLVREDQDDLAARAAQIRALIEEAPLPAGLEEELRAAYRELSLQSGTESAYVVVRASAVGGELPAATSLNLRGEEALLMGVRRSFASLFGAEAVAAREESGHDHLDGAVAACVQQMVRADLAASGEVATADAASGHDGVVVLSSRFGLGGDGEADQFLVHKATLREGRRSIVRKSIVHKRNRLVCAPGAGERAVELEAVPEDERGRPSIGDNDVLQLARWALLLEDSFAAKTGSKAPLEISWAKDGLTGQLYLLDARAVPVAERGPDQAAARPNTQLMLNVGDPAQALAAAQLPSDGVGLLRMEHVFATWVRVHPLALTRYAELPHELLIEVDRATRGYPDKSEYFVDKLAQGIGVIAAAFHPKPVILRLSDFKSNEYASLLGGEHFEPREGNPLMGFRGASRYSHPEYKDGFLLEVAAIRRVREEFGLTNLKLMVPFCRTPEEGLRVLEVLREGGLSPGQDGLEVHVMAELPSNVLLADQFAEIFDGLSIGSNDLTQLMLGVDRTSALVAPLYDERNPAVRDACARIIQAAHRRGKKVSICGQAPSDFPEFAAFLVEHGIDSISLTPEAFTKTAGLVLEAEKAGPRRRAVDRMPVSEPARAQVISIDRRRGAERRRLVEEGVDGPRGNAVALAAESPVNMQAMQAAVAIAEAAGQGVMPGPALAMAPPYEEEEPIGTD